MPSWIFYIPLIIYIPLGVYLFFVFWRMTEAFGLKKKSAPSILISLAVTALCLYMGRSLFSFSAVIVIAFVAFSLVVQITNAILQRALHDDKAKKRCDFLYRSGLVAIVLTAAMVGYGYFNMRHVVRTGYDIVTEKNVGDGLRIALVTDLHFGNTMGIEDLEKVCERISAEQADLVCLVGDIFDERTPREMMEAGARLLSGIKSTYGTYYVYGNHDGNFYVSNANYHLSDIDAAFESGGTVVLRDEAVKLNDDVTLVGRLDRSMDRKSAAQVVEGVDSDDFILVLDHQPSGIEEMAEAGADLQLSGHTHAGQIWPTGPLMQLMGISDVNYGYKRIGDYQIIVSSGIAGWGYPVRTGKHSEYVVIDVTNQSKENNQ